MVKRVVLPPKKWLITFLLIVRLYCDYYKQRAHLLYRTFRSKTRRNRFAGLLDKPISLQLPITNMCNLRCKTCNVFHIREEEITLKDIQKIVQDPFMSNLTNVGINGGEPFLRRDILDIVQTLCGLPSLKQISIISNGILTKRILEKLSSIKSICKSNGVKLQFTTSIDGIDFIHDKIRGKEDAFNKTMRTYNAIRDNKDEYCDQLGIISTISRHNIFYINELLSYFKKYDINEVAYQLAVNHSRLDNSENDSFSVLEDGKSRAMALEFFYMLYCQNHSRTYYAIYRYLKEYPNSRRMSWCPFWGKSVTIDAAGGIAFCATHSPKIGNIKEDSNLENLYRDKVEINRNIIKNSCDTCIHYSRNNLVNFAEIEYLKETLFLEVSKLKFKI